MRVIQFSPGEKRNQHNYVSLQLHQKPRCRRFLSHLDDAPHPALILRRRSQQVILITITLFSYIITVGVYTYLIVNVKIVIYGGIRYILASNLIASGLLYFPMKEMDCKRIAPHCS